ncbi:MAG: molybdopterin-dependent oxidoreductase [Acidobacteria bacterium]|nr:molybdopterin-dependent oxidoreductase [Acidobacteriota bacterium]
MDTTTKKARLSFHPALGRRSFLKIGAAAYASLMSGCWSQESGMKSGSSPTYLLQGERDWASSVCSLCPSACAIRAYFEGGRVVAVGGDPDDPNTAGAMCPIGLSMLNLHFNPDRLTGAFRRSPDGTMAQAQAEEILTTVAGRIRQGGVLHIYGRITPFASYLSKILKAVCHLDSLPERMTYYTPFLNTDGRPPILDFDNARIALLFDSNILEHGYPFVGYARRIAESRLRGLKLVTLSPFLTNTATAGDWIPLRSGEAASMASLGIAQQALDEPSLHVSLPPPEIANSLRSLDGTFLERASGLSRETIRDLTHRFFSEPGPAVSDHHDPSALLLNIMKGNLNRPGGLFHPGRRFLNIDAEPARIRQILSDSRNVVLLCQSNPAFSQPSEIRPILRSTGRATVVCIDSFMSETAELSDFVLPLASPLETLNITEPLPLAQPFIAATLPVIEPASPCRSLDDWLIDLATAVNGSAPELTPERFAAESILGIASGKLASDRAVYPLSPNPEPLEARMQIIIPSLKTLIESTRNLPIFQDPPQREQYFLAEFEESIQGPGSAPSKWLNEINYSPKIYLNPRRAGRSGIRSGDRIVLTSDNGASLKGIALLFEGIHPDAVAIPMHHGHTGYGRVARGESFSDPKDPDMSRMFWGKNRGVNPAEISGGIVTVRKERG